MERGWYATGRLELLWGSVGGRDKLGALTGIQPGTLSGYNTGRLRLGLANAEKIAAALDCTLEDLGQPVIGDRSVPAQIRQAVREELEGALEPLEQLLRRLLDREPPGSNEAEDGDR